MVTRLLKSHSEVIAALENAYIPGSLDLVALYSSKIDSVIQDKLFISIPFSDNLIKGWGVFDTLNIYNSKPYQMDAHIDRMLMSAQKSKIQFLYTKDYVINKINHFIDLYANAKMRFYVSGSGEFYILAYNDANQTKPSQVKEYSVSIPPKPKGFAEVKSTNYLSNALTALESKEKGGYLGVNIDEYGNLAEASIANVAVVLNNQFLTPLPGNILEGTTIKRAMVFCEELVREGVLDNATRRNISLQEAYNSSEMMLIGGDSVTPISHFDDRPIGNGIGPITKRIIEFISRDKE